jgi:hypothetical protein
VDERIAQVFRDQPIWKELREDHQAMVLNAPKYRKALADRERAKKQ